MRLSLSSLRKAYQLTWTFAAVFAALSVSCTAAVDEPDKPAKVTKYTNAMIFQAAFAARAPLMATLGTVDKLGVIHVWNTRDWKLVSTFTMVYLADLPVGNLSEAYDIALSPDGTKLAISGDSGAVSVWQVWSGRPIWYMHAPVGSNARVAWSPDGKLLAAGGDCIVRIWDIRTSDCIRTIPSTGWVAFSPDGKTLGTASRLDAFLWSVKTGKKIMALRCKAGGYRPIAFSPDGKYVATDGDDANWQPEDTGAEAFYHHNGRIMIWDRRTGKVARMLVGSDMAEGGTRELLFYDNGRKLLGSDFMSVSLRDAKSGEYLNGFENTICRSALSPDGKMIAVYRGNADGDALVVYDTANDDVLLKIITNKISKQQ